VAENYTYAERGGRSAGAAVSVVRVERYAAHNPAALLHVRAAGASPHPEASISNVRRRSRPKRRVCVVPRSVADGPNGADTGRAVKGHHVGCFAGARTTQGQRRLLSVCGARDVRSAVDRVLRRVGCIEAAAPH
jgi:hypothetical protein